MRNLIGKKRTHNKIFSSGSESSSDLELEIEKEVHSRTYTILSIVTVLKLYTLNLTRTIQDFFFKKGLV